MMSFILLLLGVAQSFSIGLRRSSVKNSNSVIISSEYNKNAMLSFVNSSSFVSKIVLRQGISSILNESKKSELMLDLSTIVYGRNGVVPFFCEGVFTINSLTLLFEDGPAFPLETLAGTTSGASVILSNTSINNIVVRASDGSFLSSGSGTIQLVLDCSFNNITTSKATSDTKNERTLVLSSTLKNTYMNSIEDYFYGRIVTGLSRKTENVFTAVNSTFNKCFRVGNVSKTYQPITRENETKKERGLMRKVIRFVKNESEENSTQSNQEEWVYVRMDNVTISQKQELISTYNNFTRCTFSGCSAVPTDDYFVENGGAISVSDSESSLVVDRCTFSNCECRNVAGAIFCDNTAVCSITDTDFKNCHARANAYYYSVGGAVFIGYVPKCTVISDCTFDSCSSEGDISITKPSSENGGIAGALYMENGGSQYVGCEGIYLKGMVHDCTFSYCSATSLGGAIYFDINDEHKCMRNIEIEDCYAGRCGGAMAIEVGDIKFEEIKVFFYSFKLRNNKAGISGHDVVFLTVESGDYLKEYPKTPFDKVKTDNKEKRCAILTSITYSPNSNNGYFSFGTYDYLLDSDDGSSPPLGWIAAPIVVFVIIVIVVIVICVCCGCCCCKKKK